MGIGWLLVPLMFFIVFMMFMSSAGSSMALMIIIGLLLLILGGIGVLIWRQSKSKPKQKRKRGTYNDDYGYDGELSDGELDADDGEFYVEYHDTIE